MIKMGDTQIICAASIESKVPPFLRNTGSGWITAEYGMLPRSTGTRMRRESSLGKVQGRTQEIQRLIGRSLRAIVDLDILGERQIIVDCDVINADGGTRCASITGAYVALHQAISSLIKDGLINTNPIRSQVAAISCGVVGDEILLDLDYSEDSTAHTDANFVLSSCGNIIEVQASAEKDAFSKEQFLNMLELAENAGKQLFNAQGSAIAKYNFGGNL
jgi:ribonuclease PH